jgi:hypothetical protein
VLHPSDGESVAVGFASFLPRVPVPRVQWKHVEFATVRMKMLCD